MDSYDLFWQAEIDDVVEASIQAIDWLLEAPAEPSYDWKDDDETKQDESRPDLHSPASARQIAEHLGLTVNAVNSKLRRLREKGVIAPLEDEGRRPCVFYRVEDVLPYFTSDDN